LLQQGSNITVIFNSQVKKIESSQVSLAIKTGDGERIGEKLVPARYVFVFAGGEPPYALLKKIGVHFGGASDSEKQANS
jgi:thioredoxin reductase